MASNTSLVDELLSRVDIVDVIGSYVPLKRAGANFSGCCPFHNEKTPSFMVSPQKQIFKCFGCGVGGNIFSFVQEIEKIDFRDAVKFLAEREHIDISQFQTSSSYQQYSQDTKEKLKRMHKLAQDFFVEQLKKDENAMQYLTEKRKLTEQVISDF
jgi:DNA primase